jgi:hypothetical protein
MIEDNGQWVQVEGGFKLVYYDKNASNGQTEQFSVRRKNGDEFFISNEQLEQLSVDYKNKPKYRPGIIPSIRDVP